MLDIIINHILEILPYYIIFESFYYITKKSFSDFNTIYFLLHFIVNLINTILILPYINILIQDPLKFLHQSTINSINPTDSTYHHLINLNIIYPMVIGLHTFHLIHHLNKIKYDEFIHHTLTHTFWYIVYLANNPIYIIPMIGMSGIPGGITYLLLFLNKFNYISSICEKKISMYLNIWLRAPMCIIFTPLLYIQSLENNLFYETLFMIAFTMINGIHFMHNITESYYNKTLNNN